MNLVSWSLPIRLMTTFECLTTFSTESTSFRLNSCRGRLLGNDTPLHVASGPPDQWQDLSEVSHWLQVAVVMLISPEWDDDLRTNTP